MASFRLAVFGTLFSTLGAVIIFALVYAATFGAARDQFAPIIASTKADLFSDMATDKLPMPAEILLEIPQSNHTYYSLADRSGKMIAGNIPMPADPLEWQSLTRWDNYHLPTHVREIVGIGTKFSDGDILFIGEDASALANLNTHIAYLFAVIFGFTIVLGLLAATLIAFYNLKRVTAISQTSHEIMAGDLSHRIKLYGLDDELDFLTTELNDMLGTIQMLVENTRQVTNDIAHDLRSPLSKLRDHLEMSRRSATKFHDGNLESEQAFTDALGKLDDIFKIFDALLRIAEIDVGVVRGSFTLINISALCQSLIESYEGVAEDHHQSLTGEFQNGLVMIGDQALIMQMLVNILENAIRYCPPGTGLCLLAVQAKDALIIEMRDHGPGIPENDYERVFNRFVRLDTARNKPGNGLGLPMVKAIASLHGGIIRLRDNHPGLVIQITLPINPKKPSLYNIDATIVNSPYYNAHQEGSEHLGHHRVMQRFPSMSWPKRF